MGDNTCKYIKIQLKFVISQEEKRLKQSLKIIHYGI